MQTRVLSAILLGLILVGCGKQVEPKAAPVSNPAFEAAKPEPVREYKLEGEVVSVNAEKKSAVINHRAIEGFMEAMKMSYPVPEQVDIEKLKAGEHITATVYHSPSESRIWIAKVEVQK